MRDPNIRQLLRETELLKYLNDPSSKVVEELNIPVAKARIDIAVINGFLHGYEIKSASDTLQRLPGQIEAYSKVFDYLTVVTENKYYDRILKILPEWIGLCICSDKTSEIRYVRIPCINNFKNGFYIAKLLWREELFDILHNYKIKHKKQNRNWILCELISANLDVPTLSEIVRKKLKQRNYWKIKEGYEELKCDDFGLSGPM